VSDAEAVVVIAITWRLSCAVIDVRLTPKPPKGHGATEDTCGC
jgi:hypothetical protein